MGKARIIRKAVGLWAKEGVRVTMGCRVRELSRVGLEIFPCVLSLMSVVSPASAEASVLGPDCPHTWGKGPSLSVYQLWGLSSPPSSRRPWGWGGCFLSSSCGREPFPQVGSRTKDPGEERCSEGLP